MFFRSVFSVFVQNLVLFQKVMVFYMAYFVIRILWFLVVIIGVMLFAYQVTDRVIIYYQHNTNVDVEVKYVSSVEFPSVTICKQNQFRYVFYLKFNFKQDCIPLVAHISQCALCWGWGMPGPRGCLVPGGAWSQGLPGPREGT